MDRVFASSFQQPRQTLFTAIRQASRRSYRNAWVARGGSANAQIERAVSTVLVHAAAALPEYKTLKPALPHLMGQKLERLRKLMSEAGPLKSRINGVAPLVEKLTSFEHSTFYALQQYRG